MDTIFTSVLKVNWIFQNCVCGKGEIFSRYGCILIISSLIEDELCLCDNGDSFINFYESFQMVLVKPMSFSGGLYCAFAEREFFGRKVLLNFEGFIALMGILCAL